MKRILLFLVLGVFLAVGVTAAPTKKLGLEWDANVETNLAGYKVYYGTKAGPPYNGIGQAGGDSPIDVGNVTEFYFDPFSFSIDYWFVVTAYSTEGFESGYSNEVTTQGIVIASPGGCFLRIPSE